MTSSINSSYFNLKKGGNILYPTDTVWGIGCDATNEKAVTNIFHIKKREESKSLVILVNNIEMLRQYVGEIPTRLIDILKNTTKPTTVIYKNPKGLAKNVIAKDNTVAIRIAQDEFCQKNSGNPLFQLLLILVGGQHQVLLKKSINRFWVRLIMW